MKFSEMKYVRPDMDAMGKAAEKAAERLDAAASADEAADVYLEWDETAKEYSTQMNICYIRHSINTEDEYYAAEEDFFDENGPLFSEMCQKVAKALSENRFRSELEKRFGSVMFKNTDILVALRIGPFLSVPKAGYLPLNKTHRERQVHRPQEVQTYRPLSCFHVLS